VFDVLDIEDDAERDDGDNRCPETEVAGPYVLVVLDLKRGLYGRSGDEGAEGYLASQNVSNYSAESPDGLW
jgi:hypothetical protein